MLAGTKNAGGIVVVAFVVVSAEVVDVGSETSMLSALSKMLSEISGTLRPSVNLSAGVTNGFLRMSPRVGARTFPKSKIEILF